MKTAPLRPLGQDTIFVCIDMQRLFLEPGEWFCQSGLDILPTVVKLAEHASDQCVFTRFITARTATEAQGQWQRYYRRWHSVTRAVIGEAAMHLHDQLQPFASPERTFDKTGHDAFSAMIFADWIEAKKPAALVLFGIETDVCVLATAMTAVDLGYRVVIASDATASSDQRSHEACMKLVYPRFDQQIELVDSAQIIAARSDAHG